MEGIEFAAAASSPGCYQIVFVPSAGCSLRSGRPLALFLPHGMLHPRQMIVGSRGCDRGRRSHRDEMGCNWRNRGRGRQRSRQQRESSSPEQLARRLEDWEYLSGSNRWRP